MAGWNEWVTGANMTLSEVLDALKSATIGLDVKDKLFWSYYKIVELAIKEGNANFDVAKATGAFKDLASRLDASDDKLNSTTAQLAQEIKNIGNASPKGQYYTLANLQAAYPSGTTGVYLVTSTGHWYYWNGSVWTDGGIYQSAGIGDGQVTLNKINDNIFRFLEKNYTGLITNIFTTQGKTDNHYVDYLNGVITPASGYSATARIVVKPGSKYFISKGQQMAFFDEVGNYIGGYIGGEIIEVPNIVRYIQLSYLTADESKVMIVESDKRVPYMAPNEGFVDPKLIPPESFEGLGNLYAERELGNLFNPEKVQKGFYVSYITGKVEPVAGYSVVTIEGLADVEHLFVSNVQQMALYYNDNFISGFFEPKVVNIPLNANTAKFSVLTADLENLMIANSNRETTYVPPGEKAVRVENLPRILRNSQKEFILPEEIYVVTGEEYSIYFRNILSYNIDMNNYSVIIREINGDSFKQIGRHLDYKWYWTPDISGTREIEIRLYNNVENDIVASKRVKMIVTQKNLSSVSSPTIVTIGDSFVDEWGVTKNLYEMMTSDSNNRPNFIGLHSTGVAGVKDDAWSGQSYEWYMHGANGYKRSDRADGTPSATPNQFYNPTTNKFDFRYYMATYQANTSVDIVQSLLGINDCLLKDTKTLLSELPDLLNDIEEMWNSVLAYDSTITILPILITPLNALNDGFIGGYGTGRVWRSAKSSMRNVEIFNQALLKRFGTKTWRDKGVFLVAVNANWDYRHAIRTEVIKPVKFDSSIEESVTMDIHPNLEIGSKYIADSMRNAIRRFQ